MVNSIQMQNLFKQIDNFGLNVQNNAVNNTNNVDLLFDDMNVGANTDEVKFTTTGNAQLDNLQQQLQAKKQEKANLEAELDKKQDELTKAINESEDIAQQLSDQQKAEMEAAVQRAVAKAKNDPNAKFEDLLKAEMAGIGVNTSILDAHIQRADALGNAIKDISNKIATLGPQIKGLETQIKTLETQLAFKGDPATSANPQVQALEAFLASPEAANMSEAQFKQHLLNNFGSVIKADNNGKISVPHGHDAKATQIFTEVCAELEAKGTGDVQRTDPIGFSADGWKFDFINDKNNNGKFDDKMEFVGAENGWEELLQFDTNKDGSIEGDELNKLQTLATKNGQSKIASAADLGIDKIDLNSFKAKNELDANNNILAGVFNVDFKGQTIEGQQTLDTDAYLNKTYGHAFGMGLDNTPAAKEAKAENANPVKNMVDQIIDNFKKNVEQEKEIMKNRKDAYLLYA